jgi:DNA-binding transcriptional MerR regulator
MGLCEKKRAEAGRLQVTLRHPLSSRLGDPARPHTHQLQPRERSILIQEQQFYSTSRFAALGCVTIRTLRYYDRVGLLSPSARTAAGHRQYTRADLVRLQQILALKFLGFSLSEVRRCLRFSPADMRSALSLQKALLTERKTALEQILAAISYAEAALQDNSENWQSIVQLIRMVQASQHFSQKYYTEEQRQRIAQWGQHWTEEDQKIVGQRWETAIAELKRLVAGHEDPADPPAQALAREWHDLVQSFTHGDSGIEQGMAGMYRDIASMPAEQRPFPLPFDEAGGRFIRRALEIYTQMS